MVRVSFGAYRSRFGASCWGCLFLLGLWESVVRLPGVMRVLLSGDVLVSSRFGASC